VNSGPLLFISGQIAVDGDGKVVGKGDVKKQAIHVLENIKTILQANNATLTDILKLTVFVTDMRYLADLTDIRNQYFPSDGPASTMVAISHLALPDLLIEIDAIAVCP
jgi:reactive intermediate/imine deaminase